MRHGTRMVAGEERGTVVELKSVEKGIPPEKKMGLSVPCKKALGMMDTSDPEEEAIRSREALFLGGGNRIRTGE